MWAKAIDFLFVIIGSVISVTCDSDVIHMSHKIYLKLLPSIVY